MIAAAISERGRARDLILIGLHSQNKVHLHLSTLVLRETERNLAKKQPIALPAFGLFAEALTATVIDPPESLVLEVAKVVEYKDAPIVAAALAARAAYIATYDRKHLLRRRDEIEARFGLVVATPEEVVVALAE